MTHAGRPSSAFPDAARRTPHPCGLLERKSPRDAYRVRRPRAFGPGKEPAILIAALLIWLGSQAQVRLDLLPALRKLLLQNLRILQRRHDDAVAAVPPINRRGHRVPVGELEGIDDPQDLVEVASGA